MDTEGETGGSCAWMLLENTEPIRYLIIILF